MSELITHLAGQTDPCFSVQDIRNYGLNLFFSENTFTFTLIDVRTSKYIAVHHLRRNELSQKATGDISSGFPDFIHSVFNRFPWLKSHFRSIRIGYEGQKATLIPAQIYDSHRIRDYLNLNFSVQPEEVALSDHLPRFELYLVYAMPNDQVETMKEHFPLARIYHHGSIFMQTIWLITRLRTQIPRVFIHLRDKAFDLMIYDGKKLNYFNTFTFVAAEDVVYFVMFVMEQLGFNPEKTPAILLGNIERSSNLYELLYRYIKHVDFGRRNEGFKYAPALSELPPHGFYTLFSFQACGL